MATYYDLAVTAPFPSFSGVMNDGVLNVTAPMPVFAGVLQTTALTLSVTAPMPTFSGGLQTSHMHLDVTAPFASFSAEMFFGLAYNLAVKAPFPSFSGKMIHVYSLAAIAPFPRFAGVLTTPLNDLVLAATAPFPSFNGTMQIGSIGEHTVLVMNLKNKVVSLYENFNFNSACILNGVPLGAGADGIYVLSGDDDAGNPIDAHITLGDSDFGLPNVKLIPELFADYSGTDELQVFVSRDQDAEMGADDNEESGPFPINAPAEGKVETKRCKPPKGYRAGNWQFRIENTNGSKFNLQRLEIPVEKSQRRLN